MSAPIVGIDFDNTIATYDDVFHGLAVERGLITHDVPRVKRHVRDRVRQREDGETDWQKLQAAAYGTHMGAAVMAPGFAEFLRRCSACSTQVFVISHRTEHATMDPGRVPLRTVALDWMRAQSLFGAGGRGLREDCVFFESTRAGKIDRIASAGCSHFIDDLEEVFLEPDFPRGVVKVLYAPEGNRVQSDVHGIRTVTSWDEVGEVVRDRR